MSSLDQTAHNLYRLAELPDFKIEAEGSSLMFYAGGFCFDGTGYCTDEAVFHALVFLTTRIEFKRLTEQAFK